MNRLRAAALILALTLTSTIAEADFNAGAEAYAHGDFPRAYREWAPLARAGDVAAQFSLGVMYSKGQGVDVDVDQAIHWFRLAADQGDPAAQFTLGTLYSQGVGVEANQGEALRWYHKAALQGDADAELALGLSYAHGSGVPRNLALAVTWFERAAVQGRSAAQTSLALMYETGSGIAQHDVCAYTWFSIAAAAGNKAAERRRDALRSRMTRAQVALGQSLSVSPLRAEQCAQGAPEQIVSAELVANVQTGLKALGYEPGVDPGVVDQPTRAAIKAFQRDLGLSETGRFSEELLMLIRGRAN